ncbi:MAG: sigma-70 family RNA polymerase sigma factor, partial [Armatimonadota bacterium]|nr:sigma-70 family RNA polymerase sigma factor [Armatimonadota bacterium]
MQDHLLLRQYVQRGSQDAFAQLVKHYWPLVYSACLRELDDRQMAEDAAQGVFLVLARKAPSLGRNTPLAGWLFRTARLASRDALRQERRRKHWEQEALWLMDQTVVSQVRAHPDEAGLNEVLARLKPAEREAVLLRFFEDMSFREVGEALGVSEDTAQKRVSRAVDKMQAQLAKHGAVLPAAALIGALSAGASQAIPSHCADFLAQASPGFQTALASGSLLGARAYHISQGVLQKMWITKATVAAISVGLVGTGIGVLHAGASPQKTPGHPPRGMQGVKFEMGTGAARSFTGQVDADQARLTFGSASLRMSHFHMTADRLVGEVTPQDLQSLPGMSRLTGPA